MPVKPATITKPSKPTIEKHVLLFKFNQVVAVDIGDGVYHSVPVRMIEVPLESGSYAPRSGRWSETETGSGPTKTVPFFDTDSEEAVQEVELRDETPHVPRRAKGMSEGMFSKLADVAFTRAAENKSFNDSVRKKLYFYQDQGVLSVIDDPFADTEVEALGLLAELAAADTGGSSTDAIEEAQTAASRIEKPQRKPNGRF